MTNANNTPETVEVDGEVYTLTYVDHIRSYEGIAETNFGPDHARYWSAHTLRRYGMLEWKISYGQREQYADFTITPKGRRVLDAVREGEK